MPREELDPLALAVAQVAALRLHVERRAETLRRDMDALEALITKVAAVVAAPSRPLALEAFLVSQDALLVSMKARECACRPQQPAAPTAETSCAMQREHLRPAAVAPLLCLPDGQVGFTVEWGRRGRSGLSVLLWLSAEAPRTYLQAQVIWAQWQAGEHDWWVRFDRTAEVLNQAVFEAVEWRPALDPAQRPPGATWLLAEPRPVLSSAS